MEKTVIIQFFGYSDALTTEPTTCNAASPSYEAAIDWLKQNNFSQKSITTENSKETWERTSRDIICLYEKSEDGKLSELVTFQKTVCAIILPELIAKDVLISHKKLK
jgi:hypothetical protein